MGALTSKPYVYKHRPWEIKSSSIISLLEPTLPVVKVSIVNNNIVRVLPTVGEEEWISDRIRFSTAGTKKNTSSMSYLTQSPSFDVNIIKLQENVTYQRKNTNKRENLSTTLNIEKKGAIHLEMDSISAIKEYSTIRSVDYLNQQLNIRTQQNIPLNLPSDIDDSDDEDLFEPKDFNNYTIFIQTNFKPIYPMLDIKINSFVDNDGELYALTLAEMSNNADYIGLSKKTAQILFNGHLKTIKPALYL
jgi:NADH dehydrogenase/NADH:ubiquinone oxidoreductase subunit G